MEDIFSEKENRKLTEDILYYNSINDGEEKKRLEGKILEKVDLLIFLIPLRYGFLEKEDITEFYLAQRPKALDIVKCYLISKATFYHYLSEVLRKRARTFYMQKYRKEKADIILAYSDYEILPYDSYVLHEEEYPYICSRTEDDGFRFTGDYDNISLKDLFSRLIHQQTEEMRELSEIEKEMKSSLSSIKERKDFLILLLYAPSDGIKHFCRSFSRVLSVSEEAMIRFFELKDSYNEREKSIRREEIRHIALRHYRTLLRLNYEYTSSTCTEEEKREIFLSEEKALRCYKQRMNQLIKLGNGLTQSEISSLLGYTRSSISVSVRNARENLKGVKMRFSQQCI